MQRYKTSNFLTENAFNQHFLKDTSFAQLMTKRIYNVLLIASRYDAFILEDDGRINEKIFNEYTALNLRYPPRFTLVGNDEEALVLLEEKHFELIISMPGTTQSNVFEGAKLIKKQYPLIPIVVLTTFSSDVSLRIANEDLSAIDYVFSWLGNTELLVAIIKLIEDRMNAEQDCSSGVRTLLVVEDSIRFYSSILPQLYTYIFRQSRSFMTEALNEHQRMLRMRGRPKVILARSYEEAILYYQQFRKSMLGIISDVSFLRRNEKDAHAGIDLCRHIRKAAQHLPIIINSSEASNELAAKSINATFISKLSKTFPQELKKELDLHFGFGDLIFTNDNGEEVAKVSNLIELQHCIFDLPEEALWPQMEQDNISRWMYSRALFPLASFLEDIKVSQREDVDTARKLIFEAIVRYRRTKNRGVIAVFQRDRFDQYAHFARIGEGAMGGKSRALAFMDASIKSYQLQEMFSNIHISIPRTVVFCTDIFEDYVIKNKIDSLEDGTLDNEEILKIFLAGSFSAQQNADIIALAQSMDSPVAVRSSVHPEPPLWNSLSIPHPYYVVPYMPHDRIRMAELLSQCIKAIFASLFFTNTKGESAASLNQKNTSMAVMVQELFGTEHNEEYYPSFTAALTTGVQGSIELRDTLVAACEQAHLVTTVKNHENQFHLQQNGSNNLIVQKHDTPQFSKLFLNKPHLYDEVCELSRILIEKASEDMLQDLKIEIAMDPALDNSEVLAYRVLKVI